MLCLWTPPRKEIRMNKIIGLLLLINIGYISCKNSENEIDKLEIVKQYYAVLNNSDYSGMSSWFADSLVTKEGGYEQVYSQSEYLEFLKWDSVFDPTYEILKIEQEGEMVKATISKSDKRILFLLEELFITNQIIRFQNDKILSVETTYVNFDYPIWERNKNELLSWIDENHPELNGFIYDQTETGGLKYLKAIELYEKTKKD